MRIRIFATVTERQELLCCGIETLDMVYERENVNLALRQESEAGDGTQSAGAGCSRAWTHVAGIAAGNGRASNGRYRGVAI